VGEVLSREALVARTQALRQAGRTIAVANGCFDLLHVGHVRYLEAAAAEADVLVVAINDDLIGNFITSLEMQGCSITLLKLDDEMTHYWDAPVHTPALRRGV
jgi:cytidyltransferase-like protein